MKYFIIVIALLLSSVTWSQTLQFLFRGQVENSDLSKNEGGVSIAIIQNGATIGTAQTASNGKYTLKGKVNYSIPFDVVFSKAGMVSKKVAFDFSTVNVEDIPASAEFQPIEALDMSLFKDRPNVDFSFLDNEPVAKFDWNERKMEAKLDTGLASRMRTKIEALLNDAEKDKEKLEADYQAAIRAGDDAFANKEYENALASYEAALGYKPTEKYPAGKILELDALIKAQKSQALAEKQANQEYYNLIEAADKLAKAGELEKAVTTYKQAVAKKSDEQYPKDQITALQAQIDAKKKDADSQLAYDAAIKSGDAFMKQNSLRPARDKFEEAAKLKPSEEYPKVKLKEIADKMKAQEDLEAIKKKYSDAIAAADKLFDANDFKSAKDKYTEALTYESSSTYAKARVALCDTELLKSKAEEERLAKIKDLLAKGNTELAATKYEDAIKSYTEVITLDKDNTEAKTKLAEAQKKLDEKANAAEQEKQYAKLIVEGDAATTAKKLEDALTKYQAAKVIKETPEVNKKIAATQDAINLAKSSAERETKYNELIADGAKKFAADDLQGALAKYTEAGTVDPSKPEPAKKIAEIQKLIDRRAADEAKKNQFATLMKDGNDLIAANELEKAKAKFVEASVLDAKSPEPKAKIKEVDDLIAKNKANKAQQEKLEAAIGAGDKFFNEAKWEEAQAKYREALVIDPSNTYAKDRVSDLDLKIADRKKREQVDILLASAKSLQDAKKLEDARKKYQEVIAIDPSNSVAATQIDAINTALAALQNEEHKEKAFNTLKAEGFKLATEKKYPEAKQKLVEALSFKKDSEIDAKIKEIDAQIALNQEKAAKDEQYAAFIKQAESSEVSKDYSGALTSYEKAAGVKSEESLPKAKIKELKELIASNLANASKDEQYNGFIKDAQGLEASEDYAAAIVAYQKAGNVKPAEVLPKTKIKELNALIAANAQSQAAIDRDYKTAMDRGEKLMTEEKYLDAIKAFNDALALKPTEKLPKERAEAAEEAERKKGDGDAQYQKLLAVIETKITEADYDKAEELINRAKTFKPDDTRPNVLMEQVNQLRARDKKFKDAMASGEVLASKKSYKDAIADFEKAKSLKPNEAAPQIRIDDMNRLLKDASSANQKEELYKDYMRKGQAAVTGEKFTEALSHYQNALSVKAGDQEAKDKINEIQQILDDLANSDAEKLAKKNKFDAYIKAADGLYAQGKYSEAKDQYDLALSVDPYSSYAKARGDECARLMEDGARTDARKQYDKLIAIADKNFDEKNWDKAKEYYNRAKDMLSTDPYPKKKLAEIDAILNPVIVQSGKLEPLGEVFDGTIEDGGYVIQTNAEKRRLNKATRIQEELNKSEASQTGLEQQNQASRLDSQNEIYAIWGKVAVSTDDSDEARKARVEQLKESEVKRQEVNTNNMAFEQGENLAMQTRLNGVEEKVELNTIQGGVNRVETVDKIQSIQSSNQVEITKLGATNTLKHYETDIAMSKVAFTVDENLKDDYEDRLEIERKVDAASDKSALVTQEIGTSKYDDVQRQKANIDLAHTKAADKSKVDSEVAAENSEKVKVAQGEAQIVALAYMQKNNQNSQDITTEMDGVRQKVDDKNVGFEKVRTEANDRLVKIQSDHVVAEREAQEGETEKYRANKAVIDAEDAKKQDIVDKATEAMTEKIAYVEGQEKFARSSSDESTLSDEEQRLEARKRVENEEIAKSGKALAEVKVREENTENIKDVKKASDSKISAESADQREKNLSTQQDLDKVTNEVKPKAKIANSLGQEYPEGVSQESFSRKDEAGLITTVITRRIVVIDGHADVYVRTQTSNGITYSKNDKPSLQHVWNSETQGPDLVRHY